MNPNLRIKIKKYSGVTLIEMLAFLFIFALITVTFYTTWSTGMRHILLAKNRLIASALANEKMEIVRNLAFDDIAYTAPGNIVQEEDVARSGKTFHVLTQIKKEDDPLDGIYPNDTVGGFVDYKSVKIRVSWDGDSQGVSTSSRFVPAGIEQPNPGEGVLVVNVSSDKSNGAIVSGSTVRVRNPDIGMDETHSVDSLGHLLLVGLPESIGKYEITLTKSGWETVSTYASFANGGPYDPPVHEHASVIAGALSPSNMFQNELANFSVKTVNYLGEDVPDINYYLKGGKKLGADPNSDPPGADVLNVDVHEQTGSDGEKDHGAISPGEYTFSLEETGYKIIGIDPISPFTLSSGSPRELTVKVGSEDITSLLVRVVDGTEGPSIPGAEVHLTNALGYDKTLTTGADGLAFFPVSEDPPPPPLADGTYDISITASGFDNYSGQVSVNANQLKEETVSLVSPE